MEEETRVHKTYAQTIKRESKNGNCQDNWRNIEFMVSEEKKIDSTNLRWNIT